MKEFWLGMVVSSVVVGIAAYAKDMPELQFIQNAQPGLEQKINVGYYHIQELERQMHGVQQQITVLHAKKQDRTPVPGVDFTPFTKD